MVEIEQLGSFIVNGDPYSNSILLIYVKRIYVTCVDSIEIKDELLFAMENLVRK